METIKKLEDGQVFRMCANCTGHYVEHPELNNSGILINDDIELMDKKLLEASECIKLKDGTLIKVTEVEFKGMAGEPASYLAFNKFWSDEPIRYDEFKDLMDVDSRREIDEWMNSINESNHASAIQFIQ